MRKTEYSSNLTLEDNSYSFITQPTYYRCYLIKSY